MIAHSTSRLGYLSKGMTVFLGNDPVKPEKKNQAGWRKPVRMYGLVTRWKRLNFRKL